MAVAVGKRLPAAPKEQQDMLRLRELLGDHMQSNPAPVTGLIRRGAASTEDEMFKAEMLLVRLVCLEIQRYFYEYVYAMLVLVSNINSLSFSAHNSSTEILNGIISGSVEARTCKAKQSPTDAILAVYADIFPAIKSGNGSRLECETVGGAQYDDDDDDNDGGGDDEEAGDEGGDVEEEGVEDVHGGGDEDEEDEDAAEGEGDAADDDDDDDDDDPDEPYEEEDEEEDEDEDDEEDNDEEEEPPKKRKK